MQRFKDLRIWGESDCAQKITAYINHIQWGEEQYVENGRFSIAEGKKLSIFLGYEPYCEVNLYNSAGLAAQPFLWTLN